MAMTAVRIVLLCIGAALVCTMLRVHRPEMATAVSLAVGVAALLMTGEALGEFSETIRHFLAAASMGTETTKIVLKAAGISILSELGVQICCDAGESALAGRIRLACRVVMLGMALPLITRVVDIVGQVFA